MTTLDILKAAKAAAPALACLDSAAKNRALLAMADALEKHSEEILAANALDMEAAKASATAFVTQALMLFSAGSALFQFFPGFHGNSFCRGTCRSQICFKRNEQRRTAF